MNEDIEYLKSIAYKLGTVGAEQLSEKDGTKMLNALEPELKDSELYKQVKEVFK